MTKPICKMNDCGNPSYVRGFCTKHYQRYMKHGDASVRLPKRADQGSAYSWLNKLCEAEPWKESDDCIIWPFGKSDGYGICRIDRKKVGVHRYMLGKYKGDPERNGLHAAHCPDKCTSRSCINPNHLRWATPKENAQDRYFAGTSSRKLTPIKAREIFLMSGTLKSIGEKFGVDISTVGYIKNGKMWRQATLDLIK